LNKKGLLSVSPLPESEWGRDIHDLEKAGSSRDAGAGPGLHFADLVHAMKIDRVIRDVFFVKKVTK
jgi:hypothetical protein